MMLKVGIEDLKTVAPPACRDTNGAIEADVASCIADCVNKVASCGEGMFIGDVEENACHNPEGTETNCEENADQAALTYNFHQAKQIRCTWKVFQQNQKGDGNFTKGCKWAPDGSCILTNSDDNALRLFNLPTDLNSGTESPHDMSPALSMVEGGLIYDYCWYPPMSSWDPPSCCLVSTSQNCPTHLWDAFTGELRATYRAYNQVDEVEPAYSLAFSPDGSKLYCGFKNLIRVFHIAIPGRECVTRSLNKAEEAGERQGGIISCISVNPVIPDVYAVGSYLKTVGLYSEPDGALLCLLRGHQGGLTHLKFSPDGMRLYSGGRKDPELLCWDVRNPGSILFSVRRTVTTNQRVYFDTTPCGRFLVSGNSDGLVSVWDTLQPPILDGKEPVLPTLQSFHAHQDCVNGISVHPLYPLLATSSGQRHFHSGSDHSDSDEEVIPAGKTMVENSIKLWSLT